MNLTLKDLKPAPYNPRTIDDLSMDALKTSLHEFGDISGIVWNKRTGHLVCGHQRLEALKQKYPKLSMKGNSLLAGRKRFDVRVVDWDEKKEKAANVAANNPLLAGIFTDELEDLLKEIEGDLPELYDSLRFDDLMEDSFTSTKEGNTDPDAVPEPPEDPTCKRGDLWQLGNHRLLCGDATVKADVEKLMAGKKVDMVFTDPPYGIDVVQENQVGGGGPTKFGKIGGGHIVESSTYKKIKGDDTTDVAQKHYKICEDIGFDNLVIWGGNYFTEFLPPSRCWIVWDKEMTGNFSQAEMAWTTFETGGIRLFKHLWNGLSREGNRKEELVSRIHPTQKPVGLFTQIFSSIPEFASLMDCCGGSGSTLIACEQTNRHCYMMEIDEHYCDAIIKRWEDFTGNRAKRICKQFAGDVEVETKEKTG